jgi:hypothetical protein
MYVNGGKYNELRAIFDKLAVGANKELLDDLRDMPFGSYGHLADKYGVHWFFQGDKAAAYRYFERLSPTTAQADAACRLIVVLQVLHSSGPISHLRPCAFGGLFPNCGNSCVSFAFHLPTLTYANPSVHG